jgi:hypothetical protein
LFCSSRCITKPAVTSSHAWPYQVRDKTGKPAERSFSPSKNDRYPKSVVVDAILKTSSMYASRDGYVHGFPKATGVTQKATKCESRLANGPESARTESSAIMGVSQGKVHMFKTFTSQGLWTMLEKQLHLEL